MVVSNRNLLFQGSIFRGKLLVSGSVNAGSHGVPQFLSCGYWFFYTCEPEHPTVFPEAGSWWVLHCEPLVRWWVMLAWTAWGCSFVNLQRTNPAIIISSSYMWFTWPYANLQVIICLESKGGVYSTWRIKWHIENRQPWKAASLATSGYEKNSTKLHTSQFHRSAKVCQATKSIYINLGELVNYDALSRWISLKKKKSLIYLSLYFLRFSVFKIQNNIKLWLNKIVWGQLSLSLDWAHQPT